MTSNDQTTKASELDIIEPKEPFRYRERAPNHKLGDQEANVNSDHPLLSLPPELLESIILYLSARDAICLSISCRSLFHGVLNGNNSALWFRVGRYCNKRSSTVVVDPVEFEASRRSGRCPTLTEKVPCICIQIKTGGQLEYDSEATTDIDSKNTAVYHEKQHQDRKSFLQEHPTQGHVYLHYRNLTIRFDCTAEYPMPTDLRKILINTMLGVSGTGCQWCLCSPCTGALHFVESLGMRVCSDCFMSNVLPKQAIDSLDKIRICNLGIISSYQERRIFVSVNSAHSAQPYQSRHKPYDVDAPLVWRPHVQRLVWAEYGIGVDLDSLLERQFRKGSYTIYSKVVALVWERGPGRRLAYLIEYHEI